MPAKLVRIFTSLGNVVAVGLTLLWGLRLGFLLIGCLTAPEKLATEKIWAKLVIVSALSINGLVSCGTGIRAVLSDRGHGLGRRTLVYRGDC